MRKLRAHAAAPIAVLAALSLTATPVLARGGDDWRSRHHRHGDGIDGGAILAGLLVVGGAAAIASGVTKASQDTQPEADHYPGGPDDGASDDGGYSQAPEEPDNGDAPAEQNDGGVPDSDHAAGTYTHNGFGDAVDRCLDELERDRNRIDTIENVHHAENAYDVEGRLADGRAFACSVDEEGQVRSVDIDGRAMI